MARGVVSAAKIMISDVPRLSVLVAGYSVSEWGDKNGEGMGCPTFVCALPELVVVGCFYIVC